MISYNVIKSLPAYQKILDMGCEDLSTPLLKKRGNIRLANPLLGNVQGSYWRHIAGTTAAMDGKKATIVIYQNGYVRRFFTETPAPIKSLHSPPLESRDAYSDKLDRSRYYLIKKFLRETLGISKRALQNEIAIQESWEESVFKMFTLVPSIFIPWLMKEGPEISEIFMTGDRIPGILAKEIIKAPSKWIISLKTIHKMDIVQKAVTLLPTELKKKFTKELSLFGDLYDLGL